MSIVGLPVFKLARSIAPSSTWYSMLLLIVELTDRMVLPVLAAVKPLKLRLVPTIPSYTSSCGPRPMFTPLLTSPVAPRLSIRTLCVATSCSSEMPGPATSFRVSFGFCASISTSEVPLNTAGAVLLIKNLPNESAP